MKKSFLLEKSSFSFSSHFGRINVLTGLEVSATILAIFPALYEGVFSGQLGLFRGYKKISSLERWLDDDDCPHLVNSLIKNQLDWGMHMKWMKNLTSDRKNRKNFIEVKTNFSLVLLKREIWNRENWNLDFFQRNFRRVEEWIPATVAQFRLVSGK